MKVRYFPEVYLTDEQLKSQTIDFADELLQFCSDRQRNEPEINFSNWEQSAKVLIDYHRETRSLYLRHFASNASFYYEEFKRRWISDDELDHLVENAVNRLAMEKVAIKLSVLARHL
ncbi:MAG: hypothetical protein ACOC5T_05110 [Elusimicrobiota bacterium]